MSASIPPPAARVTPPSDDAIAMMRYDAAKKSAGVAYALWFFLGFFGAHRFYLERTGSAVAMLVIAMLSFALTIVLIGFLGLIAMGIWWFVDAFLIQGMVRDSNDTLIDHMRR